MMFFALVGVLPYVLCLIAISRRISHIRAFVLILRSAIFLSALKIGAIATIFVLFRKGPDAGTVAAWCFGVLLFPENIVGPMATAATTSAALGSAAIAVLFSFLWGTILVVAVALFRRAKGQSGALCLMALLVGVATSSFGADTLPAKTVKIIPTDDIVVLAFVDPNAVSVPIGANPLLTSQLNDPTGALCLTVLGAWQLGVADSIFSDVDRQYANAFLLQNSGNTFPPLHIDPDATQAGGDYRLFSRVQTTYRVKNGQISSPPKFIKASAVVGSSLNPCNHLLSGPIWTPAGEVETHANGARGATTSNTAVAQVNEGRIGSTGQDINRTLNGHSTPWIWSVIKFDNLGQLVYPFTNSHQIFPTYVVYRNGQLDQSLTFHQSNQETFISLDETSHITGAVP